MLRIPYLEVNATKALVAESLSEPGTMRDIKVKALGVLDLEVDDSVGEYDLVHIWGEHIHEINGLEFSKPYHPEIVAAIRENVEVYKFFFFLS